LVHQDVWPVVIVSSSQHHHRGLHAKQALLIRL
jgi:hypothetical protein